MKFAIAALAGALATTNAHQLRNTSVRKLDAANYRQALDGSADISFAKCIEVTVNPGDDDEDGSVQSAVQAGTAKPVTSYAAFYTNVYANDSEMMMVDLGTYVAAKIKSSVMKSKNQCEVCRQFEETCNPEEEEAEEDANQAAYYGDAEEGEEAEEEDANEAAYYGDAEEADADAEDADADAEGGRKLAVAIDSSFCYTCQVQGCYVEEEEGEEEQVDYEEQLAQFIENAAGCMEVENYADANGNPVYIGMACGSYGDAAEFAVFMDDACTIETNKLSAASVLASAGANDEGVSMSQLLSYSAMYMQEAFTTSLSCENIEYYDPNNGEDAPEDNYEVNEACGEITGEAVYISDCVAEDAAEEDEEQEEDETWYDFDVQDGGDLNEVCAIVNYKMNIGESFEYFYDEKTQGTTYDRDITGKLKGSSNSKSMSGGMVFLIVIVVVGIVVAPIAWLINSKKNTQASETDYQGGTLS